MTATSVLAPSTPRSWKALQRAALIVLVIAAFVALAFAAGRASVSAHHDSPTLAPTSASAPSAAGATVDNCRIRRGPC